MERYNRQIILPELGEEGQQRIQRAKVLIVGVGGLGSPVALYLTGAGVGTIGLMDDDVVSISNLQRQILYSEAEVGMPKAIQAKKRLEALNSSIQINAYPNRLTTENAAGIISQYDIVVDGCDNFATRYLINDICIEQKKPYVYGAISLMTPACSWEKSMYMVPFVLSTGKYPYSITKADRTIATFSRTKTKCSPCPTRPKVYLELLPA